jgi:hypothetical protein
MLVLPLMLVLELPPLAFGPALPPRAFAPPRELTCAIGDLGRMHVPSPAQPGAVAPNHLLDPLSLRPARERYLVNQGLDTAIFLAALFAGRAAWDERTWSTRTWQATGAVTPVLIPFEVQPQGSRLWSQYR